MTPEEEARKRTADALAGTVTANFEEEKKEVNKTFTLEDLKKLVRNIAENIILEKEFVKLGSLKEEIHNELKPIAEKVADGQKVLKEELEKLANLPGKDGVKNITGDDSEFKGLARNGGYQAMSDFAVDVYRAGLKEGTGPSVTYRKWVTDVSALRTAGEPSLEIGDPEQGGALIPPEFSAKLMERGFKNSNFLSRCTSVPMARNQITLPFQEDFTHTTYLHGAMMAYWKDELAGKTATKPKFGKTTLRLNKLCIVIYSSDELLEDSPISMEPLLMKKATDVFGWKTDEAIIRGTGAGMPLGVLDAGNAAKIPVPKTAGQAAATITAVNIANMWARMFSMSKRSAVWVGNDDIFPQLFQMSIPVGTGGSVVYLPAGGLSGKPYETLMGKEIIWTEHASALGTQGDLMLIDFGEYLIGQKRGAGAGIQFAKSIHLMFLYDQTAFRYVIRLDGQPWWPKVFTPKRGNTRSPFITLANRL